MFEAGQKVVKVITGAGFSTGSYHYVTGANKNKGYVSVADTEGGEPWGHHDIHAYHKETGIAFENNIPGFSSKIVSLEEAANMDIEMEDEE